MTRPALDLTRLRQLAEGATPGPWEWEPWEGSGNGDLLGPPRIDDYGTGPQEYRDKIIVTDCGQYPPEDNDRAFIASVSPDVVLALIERLEAAEAALVEYGRHRGPCPHGDPYAMEWRPDAECECGLAEIIGRSATGSRGRP